MTRHLIDPFKEQMRFKVKTFTKLNSMFFFEALELIEKSSCLFAAKTVDGINIPIVFEMFNLLFTQYLAHESLLT
jgi:hypothetical protein